MKGQPESVTRDVNRIGASTRVEFLEHLGHRLRDAAVRRQNQQHTGDSTSGVKGKYGTDAAYCSRILHKTSSDVYCFELFESAMTNLGLWIFTGLGDFSHKRK